jgi:SAM-dependent methyltransferase
MMIFLETLRDWSKPCGFLGAEHMWMSGLDERLFEDVEVKKANIRHHDVEAQIFERAHPEGSSVYEKAEVLKSLASIAGNSATQDMCVDVGCGTGFVTGFELPMYKSVVSMDISKQMLRTVRNRYGHTDQLNLVVCDAEFLPFRSDIADLVSVSSVLHHLPKPFRAITEMSRLLKKGGFLYATREPNARRVRRFFEFLDNTIIRNLKGLGQHLHILRLREFTQSVHIDGLDYIKADIHYPAGFRVSQLSGFLEANSFKIISAYSYNWIYPDPTGGWLQQLLMRSNFIIERLPLSKRLGRYVSITARKL